MELIRNYQTLSLEEIDQLYLQIEQLYNANLKQFNIITAGRCPYSWAGIAGTSAGATGGILKPTPAVEAIAPQVI